MCICQRNWQANDCSERVCQFGLAFVDTPKGDLDGSGSISGPGVLVVPNSPVYPYGTTESFPSVEDSRQQVVSNSAHAYMECSNAGVCNRDTGACECFTGFEGIACQRTVCPGYPDSICNGHGFCANVEDTALSDYSNTYELWDKQVVVGCICDEGFSGGDCSLRACPWGLDPTYLYDDTETIRYPIFNLALMTTSPSIDFFDGASNGSTGAWALTFYDLNGKGWTSDTLAPGASCAEVVSTLYALPNQIIPYDSISCTQDTVLYQDPLDNSSSAFSEVVQSNWIYVLNGTFRPKNNTITWRPTFWAAGFKNSYDYMSASDPRLSGYIYRLIMLGNPGAYIPMEVQTYLGDGQRPSLFSRNGTLITAVWSDGRQGESTDYFPLHCPDVKVQVRSVNGYYFLTGFNSTEKLWLKSCLGQADQNPEPQVAPNDQTNINWDYGTVYNPHIVKLVRRSTDRTDGGYFVMLIFDTTVTGLDDLGITDGTFKLLHPFEPLDLGDLDWFDIFQGGGILQITSNLTSAFFDFASNQIYSANLAYDIYGAAYDGDISCDPNPNSPNKEYYIQACLQKDDMFVLLDPYNTYYNPAFINLYTVNRIYQQPFTLDEGAVLGIWPHPDVPFSPGQQTSVRTPMLNASMHYKTYTIVSDVATNWAQDASGLASFKIYKFIPQTDNAYTYVQQCSNRGICNTYDGICDCFPGYTGEACAVQDSLAL